MPKKPVGYKAKAAKVVSQGVVDTEEIPLTKEKPRVVFRLFECLVHLEQAREHLLKVGIFAEGEKEIESTRQELQLVTSDISVLRDKYQKQWSEMQKSN